MDPAQYDITIIKGKTYRLKAYWLDPAGAAINLTNRTIRMQMRLTRTSPDKIIDYDNALKGGITVNAVAGYFEAIIPPATTSLLNFNEALYEVDTVNNANAADIEPVLEGRASLKIGIIQ